MNADTLLKLLTALLPVGEEIASIFIHNPNSQKKFTLVVGEANALEPIAVGLASTVAAAASKTAEAAQPQAG